MRPAGRGRGVVEGWQEEGGECCVRFAGRGVMSLGGRGRGYCKRLAGRRGVVRSWQGSGRWSGMTV